MIIEWLYSLHCKCRSFIRLFCYKYCQLDAHIASCSCYAERKYGNLAVPNAWVPANGSLLPRFQVWLIGAVKSRHFRSVLFSADAALRARVLFFFFLKCPCQGSGWAFGQGQREIVPIAALPNTAAPRGEDGPGARVHTRRAEDVIDRDDPRGWVGPAPRPVVYRVIDALSEILGFGCLIN